ncbi:putative peptidase family-domain-containing protein [Mucidula mucida]|nr:putative peptidase family-domain-containing protein [Mucidula mucida]
MLSTTLLLGFLASSVLASPIAALESRTLGDTLSTITIHSSCNATERRQLTKALAETYEITSAAIEYVLQNGYTDDVYRKYFGNAEPFAVIGAFQALTSGDKTGVLLRCDDIDQNCRQDGWFGHWRGEIATLETVICPLSFQERLPLEKFCAMGYNVAEYSPSYYFATDLIHRLYHVPTIGNEMVTHHADTYSECLQLAVDSPTNAPFNTHTLQYFASDVYGRVVGNPGDGCSGKAPETEKGPTATSAAPVSASTTAEEACHTHDDGEVHCS